MLPRVDPTPDPKWRQNVASVARRTLRLKTMSQMIWALGLGLLGLTAAGCEADLDFAEGRQVCKSSTDCASGLTCEIGYCVAPGENALELYMRIVPPTSSAYVEQQTDAFTPGGPALVTRLLEPAIVRGVVQHADQATFGTVSGDLEARTEGVIPGRSLVYQARANATLDGSNNNYELRLLEDREYRVVFRPDDPNTPPYSFTLEPEEIKKPRKDIKLPNAEDKIEVAGLLKWPDPSRGGEPTPVQGARVVAVTASETTAEVLTDEKGSFSLVLAAHTTEARFRIKAPVEGPLFPTYLSDPLAIEPGVEKTSASLTLPSLEPGVVQFEATVSVVDAQGEPVQGLTLNLHSTIADPAHDGTLRLSALTGADGVARFQALPGLYECVVDPVVGMQVASWKGEICLGGVEGPDGGCAPLVPDPGAAPAVEIALGSRVRLAGLVSDVTGRPLFEGAVVATRQQEKLESGQTLAIAPSPFQGTVTDGIFELYIDPGVYDIRITPSLASAQPPLELRDELVAGDRDLELRLPAPDIVRMQVLGASDEALSNVTVEFYVEDELDPASAARQLVKGVTDDDGFVDMLVPFVE